MSVVERYTKRPKLGPDISTFFYIFLLYFCTDQNVRNIVLSHRKMHFGVDNTSLMVFEKMSCYHAFANMGLFQSKNKTS